MHKMNVGGTELEVPVEEVNKKIFEFQQKHLNKKESIWEEVDAISKTKRTCEVNRFGLAICLYYFDLRLIIMWIL